MKLLTPTVIFLLILSSLQAQNHKIASILNDAVKETVSKYPVSERAFAQVIIRTKYGHRQLIKPPARETLNKLIIEKVILVYSDYPKNNDTYQRILNRARIKELAKLAPEVLDLPVSQWEFVKQTDCPNQTAASRLFHGFILSVTPGYDPPDFTNEADLMELLEEDSTVSKVITRNQNWSKMLVITDLTSSMSPYTAQLLVWFKLSEKKGKVEHFVFFNDGDNMLDEEKEIGQTGGIYDSKAASFDEVADLATKVVNNGFGGDIPENNIEAVLYGIDACPDCEEVVMIADNLATPRDLELLERVNKPIRVILCGTDPGLNTAYLDVAYKTGGSVHTIEQDIFDLLEMNEGEELTIGNEVFKIKDGKFELVRRI